MTKNFDFFTNLVHAFFRLPQNHACAKYGRIFALRIAAACQSTLPTTGRHAWEIKTRSPEAARNPARASLVN
jgi:hypothetical protein